MATFYLKLSDGKEVETSIDVPNGNEALNAALNALAQFTCRHFPPPEDLRIVVSDEARRTLATLSFTFRIDYEDALVRTLN